MNISYTAIELLVMLQHLLLVRAKTLSLNVQLFQTLFIYFKVLPPMHFRLGLMQGINLSQAFEADIGLNELQQSIWCNAFRFPKSTRQCAT